MRDVYNAFSAILYNIARLLIGNFDISDRYIFEYKKVIFHRFDFTIYFFYIHTRRVLYNNRYKSRSLSIQAHITKQLSPKFIRGISSAFLRLSLSESYPCAIILPTADECAERAQRIRYRYLITQKNADSNNRRTTMRFSLIYIFPSASARV